MEKPVIFNSEMVRKILSGEKTQTRRPVGAKGALYPNETLADWAKRWGEKPRYQVGDLLYVREAWADIPETAPGNYHYKASANKADLDWFKEEGWKWKPSIHMPKAAARIWLEVVDVGIERLTDISEEDAKAEGSMKAHFVIHPTDGKVGYLDGLYGTYKEGYELIWDSIYATKDFGWADNPIVWKYTFRRVDNEHR